MTQNSDNNSSSGSGSGSAPGSSHSGGGGRERHSGGRNHHQHRNHERGAGHGQEKNQGNHSSQHHKNPNVRPQHPRHGAGATGQEGHPPRPQQGPRDQRDQREHRNEKAGGPQDRQRQGGGGGPRPHGQGGQQGSGGGGNAGRNPRPQQSRPPQGSSGSGGNNNNNNNGGRRQQQSANRPRRPLTRDELLKRAIELFEQHNHARKKYFEFYHRVNDSQRAKLEKDFSHTAEVLRKFENEIPPYLRPLVFRGIASYQLDTTYSQNHELPPEVTEKPQGIFDDPHVSRAQAGRHSFKEDSEESVGSMEDYLNFKNSKQSAS